MHIPVSLRTGQSLRRLGLTFEALAMLAMLSTLRGQVDLWEKWGLAPNVVLPIVFVVGIGLWSSGIIIIRKERAKEGR
jgi:hypothetical protein